MDYAKGDIDTSRCSILANFPMRILESSHGLNVAFRMLDLDGNATLGITEFQEVYSRICTFPLNWWLDSLEPLANVG